LAGEIGVDAPAARAERSLLKKVSLGFVLLVFACTAAYFVACGWGLIQVLFPRTGPQDVDVRVVQELTASAPRREGIRSFETWMTEPHTVEVESSLLPDRRLYIRYRLQRGAWRRDVEFWVTFERSAAPRVRADAHSHEGDWTSAVGNLRGAVHLSSDHLPVAGDPPLLMSYDLTVLDGGSDVELEGAFEVHPDDLR
jgi:hypothetical protein